MISAESGIHRPSNNGAPARQRSNYLYTEFPIILALQLLYCATTRTVRRRYRSQARFILRQDWNNKLFTLVFRMAVLSVAVMRWVRDFAQIKLREQNKNKRLD